MCLESYTQIYLHVLTAIYTPYVIWKGEKGITKKFSYFHQSSSQLCILNECLMLFKIFKVLFYKQYEQQILIIAISSVYIPKNLCNTYLPPLDSARRKRFFFFFFIIITGTIALPVLVTNWKCVYNDTQNSALYGTYKNIYIFTCTSYINKFKHNTYIKLMKFKMVVYTIKTWEDKFWKRKSTVLS